MMVGLGRLGVGDAAPGSLAERCVCAAIDRFGRWVVGDTIEILSVARNPTHLTYLPFFLPWHVVSELHANLFTRGDVG